MGWKWSYNRNTLCVALLAILASGVEGQRYFGVRIGPLSELEHQVKGDVYAVDSRTIHIKGFSYDGSAPDAYFYAGTTPQPSEQGFIIPNENGGVKPLGRYRNQDITLTLPDGKTFKDIGWISVWCRAFAIDFGNVPISSRLDYPRPQKIESLPTLEHGVSSDRIVVVDAQTFLIPNFNYDGAAPDGHFWVGKGSSPGPKGTIVPDENGSEEPLKRYSAKTIVITLPGDLTVFDIDFLSVWCRAFFADFGHVRIPKNLNVPPSLKMLGVAPQTKLNCEVLWDDLAFEVRWAVAGESIVMQLVGRIDNGQYMSFGTSGALTRSVMVGGDVVVAWLDQETGRGEATDYALTAKAQCQGGRGACPDDKITGSANNVRLLNAALINDFTMLTFQRPLRAVDQSDAAILTNGSQAVIWAVGPVNSQGDTSYHTLRSRGDLFIDFGRTPRWNCPLPEEQGSNSGGSRTSSGSSKPAPAAPTKNPWYIPPIPCYEPADGVFYAQIGPTGGDSGYNAITGHVGWGISWYINGLLIPEINVIRGKTYTFVVEGGSDPDIAARYHPLYITDDPEGGYEFKTPAERNRIRVFAGVGQDRDGTPVPTANGRLCEWNEDPNQPSGAFESFGAYQRTLELNCQEGQPGILQWTPDANTPNTVYYQCYTHRFLGWKINVVDQCDFDQLGAGSIDDPTVVPGPDPGDINMVGFTDKEIDYITVYVADYDYYDDYFDGHTPGDINAGSSLQRETNIPRDFNRIPSAGNGKPSRRPETGQSRPEDQGFPDHFAFPDFPYDFPSGFGNFPFDLEQEKMDGGSALIRPRRPSAKPSQPPPLGAPGFTFPKLPSLKNPTSVVDATAFAKLVNKTTNFSHSFSELSKEDVDSHATVDIPSSPIRNHYPLKPKTTSTTAQTIMSETPKFTPPPRFSMPTQYTSSSTMNSPTSRTTEHASTSYRTPSKPHITLKQASTKAPFHQLTQSIRPYSPLQTTPPRIPNQSLNSTPFHQTVTSVSPYILTRPTTRRPVTMIKQIPTRQPVPSRQTEGVEQTTYSKVSHIKKLPLREDSLPPIQEPDVITAPSLPRLPGQLSPVLEEYLPFRLPTTRYTTLTPRSSAPPKTKVFGDAFAQNFGFDPQSVVYESDFRPVRQTQAGPTLAFEVSSLDANPIKVPLPPRPPRWSSKRRPAGPRTSGPIGFSHRIIKVDDDDETINNFPNSPNVEVLPPDTLGPIFHPSVTFSESLENSPIPMPVAMGHVVPILGGGASNKPLIPNQSQQLPRRRPNHTNRRNGPVRSSVSVDRMGKPQVVLQQQAERRRITALVPLPDDLTVPVPQLVGPRILKPILNFPVEIEELTAAASAQVFASDGRRLSPDTVPAPPPQLPTRRPRPLHQITNRPQVGPFRGALPPPVPAQVPHLTQFFRQRRPTNRHTTPKPPPLEDDFINPIRLSALGSNPRPAVIMHQEVPVVAAALLPHQQLSIEIGNEVIAVIPKTAEAYAPARPPTTQRSDAVAADNNRTHINILKDVWAILTMEDPDLKPKHPRDDAHPDHDHDHLDRQERGKRRRRETRADNSSSTISNSAFSRLIGLLVLSLGW